MAPYAIRAIADPIRRFVKERLDRLFNFGKNSTGKVSTFPIFFLIFKMNGMLFQMTGRLLIYSQFLALILS